MSAKSLNPPADNTASSTDIPESSLNSPGFTTYPEILNVGFEYPSDKTLTPIANLSPVITTVNSNKITSFGKEEIPTSLPLQIEIIDFGSGIPSNLLPNIFDPFVSSKKEGKGLGLSIVASGLEEMGAIIDVTSNPGLPNFCMNFPLKKSWIKGVFIYGN